MPDAAQLMPPKIVIVHVENAKLLLGDGIRDADERYTARRDHGHVMVYLRVAAGRDGGEGGLRMPWDENGFTTAAAMCPRVECEAVLRRVLIHDVAEGVFATMALL